MSDRHPLRGTGAPLDFGVMRRPSATRPLPAPDDQHRASVLDRVLSLEARSAADSLDYADPDAPDPAARGNLDFLRWLVAFGSVTGAGAMLAVAIFLADRVPIGWVYASIALHLTVALVLAGFGSRLPDAVTRFLCFDVVVLHLAAVVALGESLGYIGLLYVPWPALTVGLFGTRADFLRISILVPVSMAIAVAVGDVPAPALAWGAAIVVAGVSVLTIRGIAYRARVLVSEMNRVARTDPLTGLLNRRAATDALDRAVARAKRQETELAVAVFDLDHFKRINDTLGHPAGDAALRRFAEVLLNTCSGTDVAARLGGEEFVVLLLRSGEDGARVFAERFSNALDFETARDEAPLSVSAGVAALSDELCDSERLLVAADRALYAAKRAGRHRVVAASDPGVGPLGAPA